jgi:hypothetical protein
MSNIFRKCTQSGCSAEAEFRRSHASRLLKIISDYNLFVVKDDVIVEGNRITFSQQNKQNKCISGY